MIIILLIIIGIYLGMTEEPRMDYSEAWDILTKER